jgi:muramoyltetrapeptide carboxypeptidase
MTAILPPPMKTGDTIGVMAPSSYVDAADLDAGKAVLETMGYKVVIHPQSHARLNQSAGTNAEKRDAFHDLLRSNDINAIMFAAGGNRALHWANDVDSDIVKAHAKPVIGFSDATAPLNILSARTGLVTYHGPSLRWLAKNAANKADKTQCLDILGGGKTIPLDDATVARAGKATGRLAGGNASLFQYLLNDVNLANAILFLEDWNIETSRLDLLFCTLRRAGVFDKINSLILGTFDNLQDTGRPFGFTLEDIIQEHTAGTDFPIIMNAPFGHGERLITLPIGASATLDGTILTLA